MTGETSRSSQHDALPIYGQRSARHRHGEVRQLPVVRRSVRAATQVQPPPDPTHEWQLTHFRKEEHTSELQTHSDLVCRLALKKKKRKRNIRRRITIPLTL